MVPDAHYHTHKLGCWYSNYYTKNTINSQKSGQMLSMCLTSCMCVHTCRCNLLAHLDGCVSVFQCHKPGLQCRAVCKDTEWRSYLILSKGTQCKQQQQKNSVFTYLGPDSLHGRHTCTLQYAWGGRDLLPCYTQLCFEHDEPFFK